MKGDTTENGGKSLSRSYFHRSIIAQRTLFPQKYSTCSLFSVKSQLVCSVNKASELIRDLKKLEGKGLALK